jgi:hypothetical protein
MVRPASVRELLASLDLERHASAFESNELDLYTLPLLTDADLRELGLTAMGPRKRLLAAIASLAGGPGAAASADAPGAEGGAPTPSATPPPGDTTLRLWDGATGAALATLAGHTSSVWGALALPDGRLVSWSDDNTLRVWDGATGAALATLAGHTSSVWGALALPDGRLVSWSGDNTLRLWDGATGAIERHARGAHKVGVGRPRPVRWADPFLVRGSHPSAVGWRDRCRAGHAQGTHLPCGRRARAS